MQNLRKRKEGKLELAVSGDDKEFGNEEFVDFEKKFHIFYLSSLAVILQRLLRLFLPWIVIEKGENGRNESSGAAPANTTTLEGKNTIFDYIFSILQCFQCFFHLFCSAGTLMNEVFNVGNTHIRSECYDQIAFYVFFQAAQGLLMLIIVLDILVLVKFPLIYRNLSTATYIAFTVFPTFIFSIFTTFYGFLATNDDIIFSCSPKTALGLEVSIFYKYLYIFLANIILILYIILLHTFHLKSRTHTGQMSSLKTMKRLQITVVIFIFTWFFSQVFGLVILKASELSDLLGIIIVHDSLFVCLSYCNTFYITMWRSKDYRDHFYRLWCPKPVQQTPKNSELVFQIRATTV
ncbi:Protein CBG06416 [Caenorhabditis briggsae]|uniref:Protein CBG06416 n=1 Tax=Caenorhabditis briggsae TaxID=6238 RepID=A8X265_CAEBR|nr:Protein CBG06416 [Caenorhabditis briggsae]CAP26725.1 Protein CBG06416 [Caenorhabditis briggsae]